MNKKAMLTQVKNQYFDQLVFAKQSGFEAVMLPINCDSEPYYLEAGNKPEYFNDIADESGWMQYAVIDFVKNVEKMYNLYDIA